MRCKNIKISEKALRDVINYYVKNDYISFQVLHLIDGKINKRDGEVFALYEDEGDAVTYYVTSFYEKNSIPKEILVGDNFDTNLLSEVLNTKVVIPQKGIKKKFLVFMTQKIIL